MASRPLLLAHAVACEGPWTPTDGLVGVVTAKGFISEEDEVHIHVRNGADAHHVASITKDTEFSVSLPKGFVKANHVKSSGREVFVWVS